MRRYGQVVAEIAETATCVALGKVTQRRLGGRLRWSLAGQILAPDSDVAITLDYLLRLDAIEITVYTATLTYPDPDDEQIQGEGSPAVYDCCQASLAAADGPDMTYPHHDDTHHCAHDSDHENPHSCGTCGLTWYA